MVLKILKTQFSVSSLQLQAMEKSNFGALLTNLGDKLSDYPSNTHEDDEENMDIKSVTPPPGFDELEKSQSRTATLRSSSKLKSALSFRREKS